MVWLHGGGFVNGSGNAFNGERLAKTAKHAEGLHRRAIAQFWQRYLN